MVHDTLPFVPPTWKRILFAGFFLLLFLIASIPFVAFFFVPVVEAHPDSPVPFFLFFISFTAVMVAYMQFLTLRIFVYPGIGSLRPKEIVLAELEAQGAQTPGIEIQKKKDGINFCYTYLETAFDSGMTHQKAKQTFSIRLRFKEEKAECHFTNTWVRRYNIAPSWWGFGIWTWSVQRGMIASFQYDRMVTFDFLRGRVMQEGSHWNTEELQRAVIALLVKNGWTVRGSLF